MDNIIIIIELGTITALAVVALLYQQIVVTRLSNRVNRIETNHRDINNKAILLEARDDHQTENLQSLWEALSAVQDHVGVVTPEQLSRLAAIDHIRQEYRSLGLAVDADELDESQLRELGQALLTLKVAPVRRETDDEVNADLQALFDNAHPDNTGPLPHAADHTDEQALPSVEQFPETPADPSVPWSSDSN